MSAQPISVPPQKPSESERAALLKLLTDDDPVVYRAVRENIVSYGPGAAVWLKPHLLSNDAVLRRRAREIVEHFRRQDADVQFLAFCLNNGEELDLETAVWMLAQTAFPDANCRAYQAILDQYAAELTDLVDFNERAGQILGAVNGFLFDTLGFSGNEKINDPDNSYLTRVLDRRTGNPTALCVLYMLLARRIHLPVSGIGLPGHFICRYQSTSDELYIDVFNGGRLLTKADCIQYLVQGNHSLREDFLTPVSARNLLKHVCRDLHRIYVQRELVDDATRMQRYLVALKG